MLPLSQFLAPMLLASLVWTRRIVWVGLACYAGGRIGLSLAQWASPISLIGPAAGIALAALLRWGLGMWPGVGLAAFFVALSGGASTSTAFAMAVGSAGGPLVAAWILQRAGLHRTLDRAVDLWLYCAVGAGAGTLLTIANGALWTVLSADPRLVMPADWLRWWLSDAAGVMLVGVPLTTLSRESLRLAFAQWRWASNLLLSLATIGCSLLAFDLTHRGANGANGLSPLLFVPHVLLCWLTLRGGVFVASATTLVLAMSAALATGRGHGPFVSGDLSNTLELLGGYVGTISAIPLLVSALAGELTARAERWQVALDHSNVGVAEWKTHDRSLTLSPRWLSMLGHDTQSFGFSLEAVRSRIHHEDLQEFEQALSKLRVAACQFSDATFRMQCRDGSPKWLQVHAAVGERSGGGELLRVIFTARDITEQRAAEDRHQLSAKLFEHLQEGLLITDAAHRALDVNPTFSSITGYTREEVLGTVPALMRPAPPGTEALRQQTAMNQSLLAHGTWRGEIVDRRRNGEACTLQVTISAVKSCSGQIRFYAFALTDVTQAQLHRSQLERQVHSDELTGLPNRNRLGPMLDEAMRASTREGFLLTICYFDLDHFKPVNDRHGHEAGDRLLVELAERLRRSLRQWSSGDDAIARLGGDEFVLLLRTATVEEARQAVERIMRSVSQPYGLGVGEPVHVTASIGATVYPVDKADAETLLRHADHAMYGAKQAGRNGYLFFDAEHERRTRAHFEAIGRVQDALDANQFALYYQPKVDMRLAKVLGFEALLRWKHPDHGVITPAQFLPLIEHTGLSARVGDWVLQQGIEQLAMWQRMGLDITVSVNISARHLQEPLFTKRLAALLDRHSTPVAHRLIIEVLETAALADVDYTCKLMNECREFGVRFALDDFGTGYSTFTYLKRLPLDMLKIDRSFVHNMLDDRQDMAIVEGVIGLSQTFGCTVVAEGVESAEQARRLIELGCTVGQGYGIAPPMPVDEVGDWVRNYRGDAIFAREWAETVS